MTLLTAIKKDQNIRRIFGKRELVIIAKQLLGVKLTKSETTRLSRDIRKKFLAIESLSNFKNEFNLKKGAEIRDKIEEAKEIISETKFFTKIKRIILFGSAVENKLTLNSDIDIAVDFNNISKTEAILFRKEVLGKLNDKIDVQVYNILPRKLKLEINEKGRIIYEQKN